MERRTLLLVVFACVVLGGACDREPPGEPYVPRYTACTTSDDCPDLMPHCRAVDPAGSGNPVSICTLECDPDDPEKRCPSDTSWAGPEPNYCLGIDSMGRLDPTSDDKVCLLGCPSGSGCNFGWGEQSRDGECALLAYDNYGPLRICLEEGTPFTPYDPIFSLCDASEECSNTTPDCRTVDPLEVGTPTSWCTKLCEDDSDCPGTANENVMLPGRCLGVDLEGHLDPDSTEKQCFMGCEEFDLCVFGAGTVGSRSGGCAALAYGSETVNVCVQ